MVFLVELLLVVACNCVNFDNADLLKRDLALSIEQKCGGFACLLALEIAQSGKF
jgi:hypothetical protein